MNVISEKDIGQSGKVKGDSTKGPDAAQKGDVPSTQKGDVPSTQKGDVPSTQKGDVPSTQKGDVPSTQKGDVPSTQKGDVPSTQKGDVPSTQKGDTVGYSGRLKEVKFATTPVMSTYVKTTCTYQADKQLRQADRRQCFFTHAYIAVLSYMLSLLPSLSASLNTSRL